MLLRHAILQDWVTLEDGFRENLRSQLLEQLLR